MQLYTPREVAALLGLSEQALAQMRYRGIGPRYVRVNSRAIRYEVEEVRRWVDAHTQDTA